MKTEREISPEELVKRAENAMKRAYAPYSDYWVGAALLTEDGTIYEGCNIENASSSPTCCAERVAFFQAVSKGERKFKAIAVVGGKGGRPSGIFPPCGVCRQVMMEFCKPDFLIHMGAPDKIITVRLDELLPYGFNSSEYMNS